MWPESFPHGGHFKELPILMGWLLQKLENLQLIKAIIVLLNLIFYNKLNLKTKVNSKLFN